MCSRATMFIFCFKKKSRQKGRKSDYGKIGRPSATPFLEFKKKSKRLLKGFPRRNLCLQASVKFCCVWNQLRFTCFCSQFSNSHPAGSSCSALLFQKVPPPGANTTIKFNLKVISNCEWNGKYIAVNPHGQCCLSTDRIHAGIFKIPL